MPIAMKCKCGKKFRVPMKASGKRVRCPECKNVLNVPDQSARPTSRAGGTSPKRSTRTESQDDDFGFLDVDPQELDDESAPAMATTKRKSKSKSSVNVDYGMIEGIKQFTMSKTTKGSPLLKIQPLSRNSMKPKGDAQRVNLDRYVSMSIDEGEGLVTYFAKLALIAFLAVLCVGILLPVGLFFLGISPRRTKPSVFLSNMKRGGEIPSTVDDELIQFPDGNSMHQVAEMIRSAKKLTEYQISTH